MTIIGLDIGTTGIKAVAYDENGLVLGSSTRPYSIFSPQEGWFELRVSDIKDAALSVLHDIVQENGIKSLDAVCATSFGESVVLLDHRAEPICDALLYMDQRGSSECDEFSNICDERLSFAATGEIPHPMLTMYKLKWLGRNGFLGSLKQIYFIADYVLHLLGGEHVTDRSLAARSGMFDINDNEWWQPGIDYTGITAACFPSVVLSGSVTGYLSEVLASSLHLNGRTKLIIGGHDQSIAALGAGALESGQIMNGLGSVDNMTVIFDKEQKRGNFLESKFNVMPCALNHSFATYLYNFSGGNLLRWFKNQLAKDLNDQHAYALLDREAGSEPTGLLVMPHFTITGTPYLDRDSRGVISGLTFDTTRGDLYRAFLEGEALEMRQNIECIEKLGIPIQEIITVGGGTSSDIWMQIRADVFGKEICVPSNREAGTRGGAILSLVSLGRFSSYQEAVKSMEDGKKIYSPNTSHVEVYNKKYEAYKALYKESKKIVGRDQNI